MAQAVKAKFSNEYWAKIKRIQRLPKFMKESALTITRKEAEKIIEEYKTGIRKNSFGLIRLKKATIKQKKKKGYDKPTTPLYGAGDNEKKSLINAFKIRKIKKGYKLFLSWAKHHEGDLTLDYLFKIHAAGCLIKGVIRIQPRPTFLKAFNRALKSKLTKETNEEVRAAIKHFIRTGNPKGFRKINRKKRSTEVIYE